jgi:hypothetical protein
MESNQAALEKELISTKQDLRMLKSFAKKAATNNKIMVRIVDAILEISLPNKKYNWESVTEDNFADIITCYEILWQDVLSTGNRLQENIDKLQLENSDLKSQLEEYKESEITEKERALMLENDLRQSNETIDESHRAIEQLKSQLMSLQSKFDDSCAVIV